MQVLGSVRNYIDIICISSNYSKIDDRSNCCSTTFILIQSANTFASAHRFVRGGKIAVDDSMTNKAAYESL